MFQKWKAKIIFLTTIFFFTISIAVYSQELSTVSAVYDFEIGDEFHIYQYSGNYYWNDDFESVQNIEIIDKYYSTDNDTLFYFQKIFKKYSWYNFPWEYDNYTLCISLTDLDSAISHHEVSIDTAYSVANKYNGRTVNHGSDEFPTINVEFVDGCGLGSYEKIIHDISWSIIIESRLCYFKKGDETWGIPDYARMESKIGEVFNYEVGDIFHFQDSSNIDKEFQNSSSVYINIEIIDKFYSFDQDTVFYVRDYISTIGEDYRDTIFYTELNSFIHIDTNYVDSVFTNEVYYWGRKANQIKYEIQQDQLDHQYRYWYVEGCGLTYYHEFLWGENNSKNWLSLIYYKKGEEEWGDPFNVGIYETRNNSIPINIYPNPAKFSVTIELPTQPSKNTSLSISNTNGQQLITQPITKPKTEIDISYLPTGIYIVKVWNDKEVMVRKVIKQ